MSNRKKDPRLFGYLPYFERPRIRWPGGARVAFWVVPNIEVFELLPPYNRHRSPYGRPLPDTLKYSTVDYGNRVGVWRMIEAMDARGVRGSVSLNTALCIHHPEIIEACVARGWELFGHGIYNSRFPHGMDEAQERRMLEDAIETVEAVAGQRIVGWLAPGMANTPRTIELIAEYGFAYTVDLFHDDQPFPVNTRKGRLTSVPYSVEGNDLLVWYFTTLGSPRDWCDLLKRQFDRLYEEGAYSGTVMCIPLHPFAVGQPHRIDAFAEALDHITGHDDVWMTTGREIAAWFNTHHYDEFVAAIADREAAVAGGVS